MYYYGNNASWLEVNKKGNAFILTSLPEGYFPFAISKGPEGEMILNSVENFDKLTGKNTLAEVNLNGPRDRITLEDLIIQYNKQHP